MRIALICSIKDEAPYIIDWIAYHRALGVTDFYVFQNDSVDGTDTLCQALSDAGHIHYFDNSNPQSAPRARRQPAQRRAYAWAMHLAEVQAVDYVMPLDIDEYIDLPDDTLPQTLTRLNTPDALSIPWRMFGSNGAADFAPESVTARFTKAANPTSQGEIRPHTQVKTLVRPSVVQKINLHIPKFKGKPRWVLPSGQDASDILAHDNWVPNPDFTAGFIRHYHVKSMAEFCTKIVRGFASHEGDNTPQLCLPMFHEMDTNDVTIPMQAPRARTAAQIAAEIRSAAILDAETSALTRFARLVDLSSRAVAANAALHTGSYKDASVFRIYFKNHVFDLM